MVIKYSSFFNEGLVEKGINLELWHFCLFTFDFDDKGDLIVLRF